MPANHQEQVSFIWSICNLLRGPYKRNEYRKVILPMTVLRRFDCLLAPTKVQALQEFQAVKTKPENIIRHKLQQVTGRPFYNLSKHDETKTKVGYEIPLNRHFYRYEPPRPLEIIENDIKKLETEILELLREVTK
jgi:type I restriction-modification system DNA methylase subunit